MPLSYRNTRLTRRPSAVAEMTIGKKYTVRKKPEPAFMLLTSRARSRAMPTWPRMVAAIVMPVFFRAIRILGSAHSFV